MKRILAFLLFVVSVLTLVPSVTVSANETPFTMIKIPYEGTENTNALKARFADTKQPITLSMYYDGYLFANVPTEDAHREIEAFVPEAAVFTDIRYPSLSYYDGLYGLSKTGVVLGDENGEANPYTNILRIEVVAMIMRLLGLHGNVDCDLPFTDVTRDDWFYGIVAEAYTRGLVEGDSETTFAPHRWITNEEITVLAARAIKYANLSYNPKGWYLGSNKVEIDDIDQVSDWAKDAYTIVGKHNITLDSRENLYVRSVMPYSYPTRHHVANLLYDIAQENQMYPSRQAIELGFDKEMPIIDGSTSTYAFSESVYRNLFCNGYPPSLHSKSHESYERLINGEVDMLFAATSPTSDLVRLAEEKGVELEYIPIAHDAMVFFTNAENPIQGLSKKQISEIYVNDAYKNWSELGGEDALIYPYCRNTDSGSHAHMEKHFLNGNEIHENITRYRTAMLMHTILTAVAASKTDEPKGYGLGYSIYYYYNQNIPYEWDHSIDRIYYDKPLTKLLAIDGVYPTEETIADGSYPLSNYTYIVLRKDTPEDSPARKMADFMLTEQGQQYVSYAGYGKLNK